MRAPHLAALALAASLAGCAGGGGARESMPPALTVAPATAAPAPSGSATFPLSISIPRGAAPAGSARSPRYVSAGLQSLALYDGTTLIYVGNFNQAGNPQFATVYASPGSTSVAGGSCTPGSGGTAASCTLTITSTMGAHTFDIITYPVTQSGTPPTFVGVILSEGEFAVTLFVGPNSAQSVTLHGVADNATFTVPAGNVPFGQMASIGYQIKDSVSMQIIQPGSQQGTYDNGPVTITASPGGIVTMTPVSNAAPPAAAGDQTFSVTCTGSNGGTVTFTAGAQTSPDTSYASNLAYGSNYAPATIGTATVQLQCLGNRPT